ncbi:MAG: hypothetical protein L0Y54_14235 [Sporichthyaceae bacterium]|nr:hypothetical protein [Sporichthyaceae bacterium]
MTSSDATLDARLTMALTRVVHAIRTQQQDQSVGYGLLPVQADLLLSLRGDRPAAERDVVTLARDLHLTPTVVADAARVLEHKTLVRWQTEAPGSPPMLNLTPLGQMQADSLGGEQLLLDRLGDLDADAKANALAVILELIYEFQRRGIVSVVRTCTTCRHLRRDGLPGGRTSYHCQLLEVALLPTDLRVDCPEHQAQVLA